MYTIAFVVYIILFISAANSCIAATTNEVIEDVINQIRLNSNDIMMGTHLYEIADKYKDINVYSIKYINDANPQIRQVVVDLSCISHPPSPLSVCIQTALLHDTESTVRQAALYGLCEQNDLATSVMIGGDQLALNLISVIKDYGINNANAILLLGQFRNNDTVREFLSKWLTLIRVDKILRNTDISYNFGTQVDIASVIVIALANLGDNNSLQEVRNNLRHEIEYIEFLFEIERFMTNKNLYKVLLELLDDSRPVYRAFHTIRHHRVCDKALLILASKCKLQLEEKDTYTNEEISKYKKMIEGILIND